MLNDLFLFTEDLFGRSSNSDDMGRKSKTTLILTILRKRITTKSLKS